MSHDMNTLSRQHIRATDTNSLLRLYDLASGIRDNSPLQYERVRAERAAAHIAAELQKREVPFAARSEVTPPGPRTR